MVNNAPPHPARNVFMDGGSLGSGDLTLDVWGVPKVSLPKSLFHGMFTFDIPRSMWFMYENGTEVDTSTNITSVNGAGRLLTDVTNTTLLLESRESPRYQPNRGHLFSMAGWFPNKTADGVREIGLASANNGVWFRLKADGLLYAVRFSGGVEVAEELIDTSGILNYDPEKNFTYDIQFQWRSAGNYNFYISDPATGQSKLVHTFNIIGTLASVSMQNPALPVHIKAVRTTENVEINVGCVDVTSENGGDIKLAPNSSYSELVAVSAADSPVLVIHNPLLINSKTNTRDITYGRISINCTKKAIFKAWLTRDPADLTGETLVALGNGSFVQTDSPDRIAGAVRATAVTVANLDFIVSFAVEANVEVINTPALVGKINFTIVRGDYIVITCSPQGAGTAGCTFTWGEAV